MYVDKKCRKEVLHMTTRKFNLKVFLKFWAKVAGAAFIAWVLLSTIDAATHNLDALSGSHHVYSECNFWVCLSKIFG